MKRTTGLGALILAFGTAAAIAAPIDDATRKTAAADTQANSAIAKLTQIGKTISVRQDVLTRLLRTLDDARESASPPIGGHAT